MPQSKDLWIKCGFCCDKFDSKVDMDMDKINYHQRVKHELWMRILSCLDWFNFTTLIISVLTSKKGYAIYDHMLLFFQIISPDTKLWQIMMKLHL